MELDDINLAIISHLADGRIPFKKIAENLGLAEGTVRARVRKLKDEGILDITALVNPEAIPSRSIAMVGIRLKDTDLVRQAERLSKLKGVVNVCVVTGRFDIFLTVMLDTEFTLVRFYTEEMAKINSIRSVETFVVYKSFNLTLPLLPL